MKSIRGIAFFFVAASAVTIVNAQEKGFKIDAATGVQYRFIKHDKKGTTGGAGKEYARIIMHWTGKNAEGNADSVFFDSHNKGGDSIGAITIPLTKSFNGCLEQAVMMMSKGDSAIFHINGDSVFLKTFHAPAERVPHFINNSTIFTFSIKLLGFETKDEMMAERQAKMKEGEAKMGARKGLEPKEITAYLQKNNLNVKPDEDSIFYLQTTKGIGPQVQEGDSIEIKYKGTFLDGGVFDPGNNNINMVYSKNMRLIEGWIKILGKMNQGEKVKVLIPSSLGYGARPMGSIQPYTPMIFDMEMVRVKSNK